MGAGLCNVVSGRQDSLQLFIAHTVALSAPRGVRTLQILQVLLLVFPRINVACTQYTGQESPWQC